MLIFLHYKARKEQLRKVVGDLNLPIGRFRPNFRWRSTLHLEGEWEVNLPTQLAHQRLQILQPEEILLTLPVPIPSEEKKSSYIFIFTPLCGASKGFMKVLKAFIKSFEAPQRSVKKKFN